MTANFDPKDRSSWYFGQMSRQDATDQLMSEREGGVFLVRDSATIPGDYVLCVREDSRVSHYIINKITQSDQVRYRIGDQMFPDLPTLLTFYKLHYLDTTPLTRPSPKRCEKVIAKYDFEGTDPDDLPFRKGEILTIVSKDEDQWWTAKKPDGQMGSIPVPYVQKYEEDALPHSQSSTVTPSTPSEPTTHKKTPAQQKLPAFARVKQSRVPNAYDKTALKLEVGELVKVTKVNINGQWEGEINGKCGFFPFTHVEFINDEGLDGSDNA